MRTAKMFLFSLLLASSPLLAFADHDNRVNGLIVGNAGTRFQLKDENHDGVFEHTVSGLVQLSQVGNCFVSFNVLAYPGADGKPWKVAGDMQIISADGKSVLNLEVVGSVLLEGDTPFGNFHYDAVIKSGTGKFNNAWGKADIDGAGLFITPDGSEGTATWIIKGFVFTRR